MSWRPAVWISGLSASTVLCAVFALTFSLRVVSKKKNLGLSQLAPLVSPAKENPAVLQRLSSSQQLLEMQQSAIVDDPAQGPVRTVRRAYLERYVWSNPLTGKQIALEIPREDIALESVAMQ